MPFFSECNFLIFLDYDFVESVSVHPSAGKKLNSAEEDINCKVYLKNHVDKMKGNKL